MSDESNGQVPELYPAWREVAKAITEGDTSPGRVLDKEWLTLGLGIEDTDDVEEYKKNQLAYMGSIHALREFLLIEHKIALRTVPGIGYEIVDPKEQTQYANVHGIEQLRRKLRWMGQTLVHVDREKLTDDERQANDDSLARLTMIRGIVQRASQGRLEETD